MQAIIDGKVPCSGDNSVIYDNLSSYWITSMGGDYHCKVVRKDHIVVWNNNMRVAENNNCTTGDINTLSDTTDLADILAVVGKSKGNKKEDGGVYCLAQ